MVVHIYSSINGSLNSQASLYSGTLVASTAEIQGSPFESFIPSFQLQFYVLWAEEHY